MGQKLSCVSKQKRKPDENLKKPCGKKLWKGKTVAKEETIESQAAPVASAKSPVTSAQSTENHLPENDAVRRRSKLVLLHPAPTHLQLPNPLPLQSSSPMVPSNLNPKSRSKQLKACTLNEPQTVDQAARDLAQGEARPATWADLYWALIEKRELKTDREKIKALFSWLCSLPLYRNAFVTIDELEQGVKDGIQYAEEARRAKKDKVSPDSPETVVNLFIREEVTYLRAFESLCRYTNIPCYTIKGLAKGVHYTVGMPLINQMLPPDPKDTSPISQIQHAWSACCVDGEWGLYDSMWAAERLAMSANARQSQIAELGRLDYETDMFYFDTDPNIFIHSHYPFEESWQLLDPPMSLQEFQDGVLLKPAFFTHGLGLFSHSEGVIPVENKLILKLSIPPEMINTLLFTFNLKLEGKDNLIQGVNLSRFGMHEISAAENVVTFNFRFPKPGSYKLTIYARKVGDPLFTDCCEYRVDAKGSDKQSFTDAKLGSIEIPPFPPTSQASYGPTEKASELKVQVVPPDTPAVVKCFSGVYEVRLTASDPSIKLPRLTARLRSLLHDASMLTDCLLIRTVEPIPPGTLASAAAERPATPTVVTVPTCVITAYLPSAGEYALEVYGTPADAPEDASYFLVWQILIDSDSGVRLSTPVRKRLATTSLGPREPSWSKLGLRTVSHPDPVIHVPTKGSAGLQKVRSKKELMQQFVEHSEKLDAQRHGEETPPTAYQAQSTPTLTTPFDEEPDPKDCDLKIVFEKPAAEKLCLVGELVDISDENEESKSDYLLQEVQESDAMVDGTMERITYLIRIPHGDRFYKFYLYGAMVKATTTFDLPLIYTYVLEAPQRLMAGEVPYVGAKHGPFPEKLAQHKKQAAGDDTSN